MVEKTNDNEFLWRQFERLGEAIGDGLHYEDPSISKEYKRISKILLPDVYKEARVIKAKQVNENMAKLLSTKPCACGGVLKQARSGSKVAYCTSCNARYKAKKAKKTD